MATMKFTKRNERAVSPVVGVMLMLVVTIIIAAVVSAFAGGVTSGQKKVPQATIKGEFSVSDGLIIQHAGGDPLPMNDLVFTVWGGPTFGPDVEQVTKQVLNMTYMMDSSGKAVRRSDGTLNITALTAGSTLTIEPDDCSCDVLQPNVAPSDYTHDMGAIYSGTGGYTQRFGLCLRNTENIGKQFVLTVSDKNGNLIGRTDVTVEG